MVPRPSRLRRFSGSLLILLLLSGLIGIIYLQTNRYAALAETSACWIDNPQAHITRERVSFVPPDHDFSTGVIIYPGGNVDFLAYAPLAGRISAGKYPVFVQKMPLDLAVFGIQRGLRIMADYPDIENWVVVGHSLGGAMAARFALDHTDRIQAVVLLAAYPDVDLSKSDLAVLSMAGDRDGVLNRQRYAASLPLLPDTAEIRSIPGGNHAGFAHYGPQRGDEVPLLTREQQQNMAAEEILILLQKLESEPDS